MKYYVFTDIHGYCTLFQDTLRDNGYFEDPEEKKKYCTRCVTSAVEALLEELERA